MDASTLSSMRASPIPLSFLDTCSLSTSSLRCNTLCMVISFLVLWSICLSSSLAHLRKDPEYLTRSTAQVYYYYYCTLLSVFHTSVGLWSFIQVSSSLQDSSQYSGRSQQCFSFDCLHSSSYFQVPLSILFWLYRVPQLRLISPSLSCSIVFSVL